MTINKCQLISYSNPSALAVSALANFVSCGGLNHLQTQAIYGDENTANLFEGLWNGLSLDTLATFPQYQHIIARVQVALSRMTMGSINIDANGRYISELIESGEIPQLKGVNILSAPTGTGKGCLASPKNTLFTTSLSLTAVQHRDRSGAVHAPTVATDVVCNPATGDFWVNSSSLATTYSSFKQGLDTLATVNNIVIDEYHNLWTSPYRATQIDEMLDTIADTDITNIIVCSGTVDFRSSHPLFANAKKITVTNNLTVDCVVVKGKAKDNLSRCVSKIVHSKGRHFVFINSKGAQLDDFLSTLSVNGISGDMVAVVNSLTKDSYTSDDFSSYRVVVATAVMQEGYSIYGEWENVHLLSWASPAALHQFTQRPRESRPTVIWYVSDKDKDEKDTVDSYELVKARMESYQNMLVKRAYRMADNLNDAIANGFYELATVQPHTVDSDIVRIHYSDDKCRPTRATVAHCAIDCKAYGYGVGIASSKAKREWLGAFGWKFIEETTPFQPVYDADPVAKASVKANRLEQFNALLDTVHDDNYRETQSMLKQRSSTKEKGLQWKETATQVLSIYNALEGDDQTWWNAVSIVRESKGKTGAVNKSLQIIHTHAKQDSAYKQIVSMLLNAGKQSLTAIALLYCEKMKQYGIDNDYYDALIDTLSTKTPKENKIILRKIKRKLSLYCGFSCDRTDDDTRLYFADSTAYSDLMSSLPPYKTP